MSDDIRQLRPQAPKVQTQIIVSMLDNGTINVTGPIQNKLLCYGMLEVAKDVVRNHVERPGSNLVIAPPGSVPQ
jgi:hypothetical protein